MQVTIVTLFNTQCFYSLSDKVEVIYPNFDILAINKHVRIIKQFFYLRHKIKELRPDCVLSMGVETNIATLLSTIGLGIKIYVADRNNPFIKLSFLRQLLKKVLYQKAEGIICQTNLARQKVHGLTKHPNIVVIPNPITIFENDYVSIEKKNYIVNVGRFIKSKNQRELIDIFTLVNDGSWKLIFVGDGPCRKECMDYVSQKGISSYVEFVGVVKDVDRYLAQSKIFAFVSTSEGFPNALGEAVLFPTASISYNCPAGPEDIIRDD